MRDLISSNVTNLSLWNCRVVGTVLSPNGEELTNNMLMTYYFNLGLDPKISLEVERKRTGNKCCNKLVYFFVGLKDYLRGDYTDARQQVKRVVSTKTLPNGLKQDKVVTDMNELTGRPLNVVGYNLNSGYGNFVNSKTWENSQKRVMDPGKALRRHKLNIVETSCDESESQLTQRIDDDKIELMCHENPVDFIDGNMARLGQVRSPFTIDCQENFEQEGRRMQIGIDGESYDLRNVKQFVFSLDKQCPKLKMLQRTNYVDPNT